MLDEMLGLCLSHLLECYLLESRVRLSGLATPVIQVDDFDRNAEASRVRGVFSKVRVREYRVFSRDG